MDAGADVGQQPIGARIIGQQRTQVAGKIGPGVADAGKRSPAMFEQDVQHKQNRGNIGLALGNADDEIRCGLAVLHLNIGGAITDGDIGQMDY